MRIVHPVSNINLLLNENKPTVLVIENKELFTQFVFDLWAQSNGTLGSSILSNKDESLDFAKTASVIINPFSINYNDKKILSSIHKELQDIGYNFYFKKTQEINSCIIDLLDAIEKHVDYPISFNLDLDLSKLFKIYDVKIEDSNDDFINKIVSYIKLLHRACGIRLVIFVNLKMFLSYNMICALYQECIYEEVTLLDIEGFDFGCSNNGENYVIIDSDLCLIETN